jgi:hypothetical protein
MEATALYEELAVSFPPMWPQMPAWKWVNVHDGREPRIELLSELVQGTLDSAEVIVLVHSKPGVAVRLPRGSAAQYIAKFMLKCDIQVSDASFTRFVLVSAHGLASADV